MELQEKEVQKQSQEALEAQEQEAQEQSVSLKCIFISEFKGKYTS